MSRRQAEAWLSAPSRNIMAHPVGSRAVPESFQYGINAVADGHDQGQAKAECYIAAPVDGRQEEEKGDPPAAYDFLFTR